MKQETKETSIFVRFLVYVTGFLIMTLGIAISVKSDLGVSPVSSIPYTMTCVWGIEMGKATILFHVGLVLLQAADRIYLRRRYSSVSRRRASPLRQSFVPYDHGF